MKENTSVRMNGEDSENFEVKVGVHQGSVLSPILFNTVMQAIADNLKKGVTLGAALCR